jgi:hypothetical protein
MRYAVDMALALLSTPSCWRSREGHVPSVLRRRLTKDKVWLSTTIIRRVKSEASFVDTAIIVWLVGIVTLIYFDGWPIT